MEEKNQNVQVEEKIVVENNLQVSDNKKTSKVAFIVCASICALLMAVSILYLVKSLNFEGLEGVALIITLPIILVSNACATIVSIINFIVVRKRTKAQKIWALIMMLVVFAYCVISIGILYL